MLNANTNANRLVEILKNEGIKGHLSAVKRFFAWRLQYSISDELWFLLNRCRYKYLRKNQGLKSQRVVVNIHGSEMLLDLSDKGICKDLFLYRSREPESTRIFLSELSEGMNVVDVGANIGYYALMEARAVGNHGKVYAVEPEPKNFQLLKKNVELNDYSNRVELFNLAVGDRTGKELFEISDQYNTHKIANARRIGKETDLLGKCIEVPITTLDEFLEDEGNLEGEGKSADFVRMDVEGYEYFVVLGLKKTLEKNHPLKMFIEVHPKLIKSYGGSAEGMLKILADANFSVNYLCLWDPSFRNIVTPFRGKPIPFERVVEYKKPLKDLLENGVTRRIIAGTQTYRIFLEKDVDKHLGGDEK